MWGKLGVRGKAVARCGACIAAASLLAIPASAQAETRQFFNTDQLFPTGGALTEGPASEYPSTISVSGVPGTVTNATVTIFGFGSASGDDIDMAIVGPNGAQVMLMSDACGESSVSPGGPDGSFRDNVWTFDDSAPTFLSNGGPCQDFQTASFKPSNYGDPADDDFSVAPGGPPPPYLNRLSFLAGGSPSGAWDLFVFDDNGGFNGFSITGWGLTLEIDPPPPPSQPPGDTGAPSPPSNAFTIGQLNGKKLSVNVSSPGTVSVADAGSKGLLDPASASGGPGNVEVELDLTKKAKQKLRRKDKVNVDAAISFTPTGGSASSQTAGLKIKK